MKKLLLLFCLIPNLLWAATPPTRIYVYNSGAIINPEEVTANEDAIFNYLNRDTEELADDSVTTTKILDGTIVNADVSSSAAIGYSKLNLSNSVTAGDITNSTITYADISASAGILDTQLAQITTAGKVSGSAITGAIAASSLTTVAWADYASTSTIVGWSATPTSYIYYKKVGTLVFVNFLIYGTSNSATTSFTVPYTSAVGVTCYMPILSNDNGTQTYAVAFINASSSTVTVGVGIDNAAWTASGAKKIEGQIWYEASS